MFVGLFVYEFVCLWVCYHDNSKLRAEVAVTLAVDLGTAYRPTSTNFPHGT